MARQLTPLGIVVVSVSKWILIPLLVGLIGYKLIGSMIGSGQSPQKTDQAKQERSQSASGKKFQSVRDNSN